MRILSRVCAEFHDKTGAVLFAVHPADRCVFLDTPDSIRQDPLFHMLLNDGSLELPTTREKQKQLENDPMKKPGKTGSAKEEPAETAEQPAPKEANASSAKAKK